MQDTSQPFGATQNKVRSLLWQSFIYRRAAVSWRFLLFGRLGVTGYEVSYTAEVTKDGTGQNRPFQSSLSRLRPRKTIPVLTTAHMAEVNGVV